MKRCNSKHMRFKGYADGGKVLQREYSAGKPTFLKAVAARFGVGDGYGKAAPEPERLTVGNAKEGMTTAVSKRKKLLDET